mmetsp:Transcript_148728/g.257562  ORF Transcript_148728/g.257562 Transcript_148728/m.257562 type:complete len:128 (+) Transcript_148728:22-405(+)
MSLTNRNHATQQSASAWHASAKCHTACHTHADVHPTTVSASSESVEISNATNRLPATLDFCKHHQAFQFMRNAKRSAQQLCCATACSVRDCALADVDVCLGELAINPWGVAVAKARVVGHDPCIFLP